MKETERVWQGADIAWFLGVVVLVAFVGVVWIESGSLGAALLLGLFALPALSIPALIVFALVWLVSPAVRDRT